MNRAARLSDGTKAKVKRFDVEEARDGWSAFVLLENRVEHPDEPHRAGTEL
jgi:hypothetical protein